MIIIINFNLFNSVDKALKIFYEKYYDKIKRIMNCLIISFDSENSQQFFAANKTPL